MLLIKMSIQNIEFQRYSQSVVVASSLYAATAFMKHSKKHEGPETTKVCGDVRKVIFDMLAEEVKTQSGFLQRGSFGK